MIINKVFTYTQGCVYYDEGKYKEAFDIFLNLAKNNNVDAQNNIACMYLDGFGVEKDIEKALFWFHKAIENKNENSEYHLGQYKINSGNIEEGLILLNKAYMHCQDDATFLLANYFYEGTYVEQNIVKSLKLFEEAAILGNKESLLKLITHINEKKGKLSAIKKVLQVLSRIAYLRLSSFYR